jgi:predicted ATPase
MISGCSGGGKSTLLLELERRGCRIVREPGRRIIAEARDKKDDSALPWVDMARFADRALTMSRADFVAAHGLTFFDRGIVDAAVAIAASGGDYPTALIRQLRYDRLFLAPPWPEIYVNDEDRRHSLEKALSDYERVRHAYLSAGYHPIMLPCDTPQSRADFVFRELEGSDSDSG